MALEFDPEVAARLEAECSRAAAILCGRSRSLDSHRVFNTFKGPYADQFRLILDQECRDRGLLVGCLRDLQDQVAWARTRAEREELRLVVSAKQNQDGATRPIMPMSVGAPVIAPRIEVCFQAHERQRLANKSSGSSVVSANPQELHSYVSKMRSADVGMRGTLTSLLKVWSDFQASCAWVDTSRVSIFRATGFERYLQENKLDDTWLTSIVQAFEQAGGSGRLPALIVTAAIVKDNHGLAVQALSNSNLSQDEVIDLLSIFARDSSLAKNVAEYVYNQVKGINKNSKVADWVWGKRLLDAILVSEETCGELAYRLGGQRIIDLISIAGSQSMDLMAVEPNHFAVSLRNVFGKGMIWLGKDPSRSLKNSSIAAQIVECLRTPRFDMVCGGGNDGYALSFLLKYDKALPTGFLLKLGNDLEAFERTFSETGYSWRMKGVAARGIGSFFNDNEFKGAFDPMAAYMGALGKNPQAALAFFTCADFEEQKLKAKKDKVLQQWWPDNEFDGIPVADPSTATKERQRYFLEQRYWSHDKFNGILAALNAAVADPSTAGREDAAALVSHMAFHFGNRTRGQDQYGQKIVFYTDEEKILPGNLGKEATLNLAHILTTHMAAVDYYLTTKPDSSAVNPSGGIPSLGDLGTKRFDGWKKAAVFGSQDLRMLIGAASSNEDGLVALRQGIFQYHQLEFSHIARLWQLGKISESEYKERMTEALKAYPKLHAECMEILGDMKIAEAKASDAWIGTMIERSRQGLQITASGVSKVFIPEAGPGPDILAGIALDRAEGQAKEAFANSTSEVADSQNAAAKKMRGKSRRELLLIMYNSGIITDENIKVAAKLNPEKFEDGVKWFHQDWNTLGDRFTTADNLAYDVGTRVCPELENYNSHFDLAFIKYFRK